MGKEDNYNLGSSDGNFINREDGTMVIKNASLTFKNPQLDRIERKMDRILELLENKETSISDKFIIEKSANHPSVWSARS